MNQKNFSLLRALLRGIALLFGLTAPPGAAPSDVDCAGAASLVEEYLCAPENGELREADRLLSALFTRMRDELPAEKARWLQESHRNWLNARDRSVTGVFSVLSRYRKRLEELERGDIVNPVSRGDLPYRVVLPGGLAGEFILEESRTESGGGPSRIEIGQRLIFRGPGPEQALWEGEGVARGDGDLSGQFRLFDGLSLIWMEGGHFFIEVKEKAYDSADSRQLIALTDTNRFERQGRIVQDRSAPRATISPRLCGTGGEK